MKRMPALLALGALSLLVVVVFIRPGGFEPPELSAPRISEADPESTGDDTRNRYAPELKPHSLGRVPTEEMLEHLKGMDGLFSETELAFRHRGILARVTESLEDFQSDWMLGVAKLERALEELDSSNAETVFDAILAASPPDRVEAIRIHRILFRAWGAADGRSALAAAMSELPGNTVRLEAGREAMLGWFQSDQMAAAANVAALPEAYGKDYLVYALPYAFIESDPIAAMDWANGLPSTLRRNSLLHCMIKWLDQDPGAARAYATELAGNPLAVDEGNGIIFSSLGRDMARTDVAGAVRWVEQLPADSKARQQAILGLMDHWGIADPEKASAWLGSFEPASVTDPAVDLFARDAARWDPAGAAGWAVSITDETLRNRCLEAVLGSWAGRDAVSARQWAELNGCRDLLPEG